MRPFELSDQIKRLRDRFKDRPMVTMSRAGVEFITAEIERLREMALTLEGENQRLRWNASAQRDRDELEDQVLREAHRPGGNVRLLQVRERPFTDGNPKGAA